MKRPKKRSLKKRRTKAPDMFVLIGETPGDYWHKPEKVYARASLTRRGDYVFLQWRDGEKVRRFYLGKRKIS